MVAALVRDFCERFNSQRVAPCQPFFYRKHTRMAFFFTLTMIRGVLSRRIGRCGRIDDGFTGRMQKAVDIAR